MFYFQPLYDIRYCVIRRTARSTRRSFFATDLLSHAGHRDVEFNNKQNLYYNSAAVVFRPGLFGIFAGNAAPDNQPNGQIFTEIVPHPTAEHLDFILHAE